MSTCFFWGGYFAIKTSLRLLINAVEHIPRSPYWGAGESESYETYSNPIFGQTLSGPAHIDASTYSDYVQTYQWPSQ